MGHIEGAARDQRLLLPDVLDDDMAEENPVRFLEAFGDSLDLDPLGLQRVQPAATGRPSSHPGDLLQLSIDGSLHRIRASRRLAQEPHRHVARLWLLRTLHPACNTMADFRQDHTQAFQQVLRAFPLLWKAWGVCGAELVALDGSQCKAVHNQQRHVTPAQLRARLHAMDAKLAQYARALDAADAAEATVAQPPAGARRENIQPLRERTGRYEQVRAAREASGARQVSLTDPASRVMPKSPTGEVGDHGQTAVDATPKRILAQHVTNAVTDVAQRSALAMTPQETLGVEPVKVVADMGSDHGEAIKACAEAGMEPYIPTPLPSANRQVGR